ncbi:MAG: type II toxin-antitoxin system Phd/YefM family antitoxin [Candidatus Dadabacteria bacterium]|nr:type II toxin-antitoxin system Phd/YefM family antitoxin [Candidatus Dadabacteria bacterium]
MIRVNIHEAKTHLSKLLERVQDGEEVIISKGNKPIARIVLIEELRPERKIGSAKGKIRIADDFDAPLEDFEEYTN